MGVPAFGDGGRGCVVGGRAAGDPPPAHPAARTPAASTASSTRLATVVLRLTATTVTRRTRRDRSPGDDARRKERRSGGEPAGHRPGAARGLGPGRIRTAPAPGRGAPAAAVRAPAGPRRGGTGGRAPVHRPLGRRRRGRGARRPAPACRGRRGRVRAPRPRRPAQPRQHRPHRHRRHRVCGSSTRSATTGGCAGAALSGRLVGRRTLVVNGHDRGHLVVAARRQRAVVEAVAGPGTPVRAVLCFADASWGARTAGPSRCAASRSPGPGPSARALAAPGPLGAAERAALARRLARAFPPYAPSGTSHRPTGASPGR